MFDFSIKNTIKRLLHPYYRKTKQIAWLAAALSSVKQLKNAFNTLRKKQEYNIQFSAQTLSLENRLNQEYNLPLGTIYIETVSATDNAVFIFWLSENQSPTYTYWLPENTNTPIYVRWISEPPLIGLQVEFIVWVPSSFSFDEQQLKALINLYKLAGKRYVIQPY